MTLINALSLQQIYRVPILIAHYFEHQQRCNSITVIEYLSMHYWDNDGNDNDEERDRELPFKKVDHFQSISVFLSPAQHFTFNPLPSVKSFPIPDSDRHICQHVGSLFKPPRHS